MCVHVCTHLFSSPMFVRIYIVVSISSTLIVYVVSFIAYINSREWGQREERGVSRRQKRVRRRTTRPCPPPPPPTVCVCVSLPQCLYVYVVSFSSTLIVYVVSFIAYVNSREWGQREERGESRTQKIRVRRRATRPCSPLLLKRY